MFRFCPACGDHRREKDVDIRERETASAVRERGTANAADGPAVVCPACGHAEPFRRLPLLLVGGASGAGKSTVRRELLGRVTDAVLLDVDNLWEPEFGAVVEAFDYNSFALRRCKQVAQNGHPTVLFGAETGLPAVVAASVERRYFSGTHHLALVCEDAVLADRLRERPNWPDGSWTVGEGPWTAVDDQVALNRWYRDLGVDPDSPVETVDVTGRSVADAAGDVEAWIAGTLENGPHDSPA